MKNLIFTTLAIFTVTFAFSQYDPKALETLDAMSKKYKAIPAFEANITSTMTNDTEGIKEEFKGKIVVKGDKFRLTLEDQEIINNGVTVWTYLPAAKEVNIDNYDPNSDEVNPSKIYEAYKKGFKYMYLTDKTEAGIVCEEIDLVPEKKILAGVILLFPLAVFSQQDPLYSQYMLNPLLINPAYTGLNNNVNGMLGYRTQWAGLEGQPTTFNASAHTSLLDNRVGLGVLFVNDKLGNISNTETNFSASYKLLLKDYVVSFGMQAGFQNYRTDYSELSVFDPGDYAFIGGETGSRMNLGAGALLKSEKFLVGLSVPRLLPSTFKNGGHEFELYNQHYYLFGSYVHYLSSAVRLKPSMLLRGVKGAPASVDLAMNINFNAIHTAGVFTRNFNTYGFLFQTMLKEQLRLGYVFELPTNKSVGTQFTSHEVSLGVLMSIFSFHDRTLSNF